MKKILALTTAIALTGASAGLASADQKKAAAAGRKAEKAAAAHHAVFTPGNIQWGNAPPVLPAGAKIAILEGDPAKPGPFTMRLKFPDGYKIQPHWHPGVEHITVISGTFHVGLGDKFDNGKGDTMPAGSFGYVAPKMHHFAWTNGETEIQIHTVAPWKLVYVNPADDPSKKKM